MKLPAHGTERLPSSGLAFRSLKRDRPAEPLRFVKLAEQSFIVFAIIIFCGVANFGQGSSSGSLESNPANLVCNVIILSIVSCLIILNWRDIAPVLGHSLLISVFVAVAVSSIFWSVEPGITLRRIGTLLTAMLVALYATSRFEPRTSIRLAGYAFVFVVGASILVAVAFPDVGVMSGRVGAGEELNGTWKGIAANKNALGWITITGVQVYAWRYIDEPAKRHVHGALILMFIFTAVMTESATALISIVFSLAVLVGLRVRRWAGRERVAIEGALIFMLIIVTLALSVDLTGILAAIGKDPTLTGRVPLWATLLDSISKHPWFGYGYNAFWLETNPEMLRVWALNPWKPPEAHNAYLDMALELGIPGAIFATLILLTTIARSVDLCKRVDVPWATFIATYSIIFLVTNLVETRLFRAGDIHCFLLSLSYFAIVQFRYDDQGLAVGKSGAIKRNWRSGLADTPQVQDSLRFRRLG